MFEKRFATYDRAFKCIGSSEHFIKMFTLPPASLWFAFLFLPMIVFGNQKPDLTKFESMNIYTGRATVMKYSRSIRYLTRRYT